jgi:hypothetical protein
LRLAVTIKESDVLEVRVEVSHGEGGGWDTSHGGIRSLEALREHGLRMAEGGEKN